jgi:hypothetical protein
METHFQCIGRWNVIKSQTNLTRIRISGSLLPLPRSCCVRLESPIWGIGRGGGIGEWRSCAGARGNQAEPLRRTFGGVGRPRAGRIWGRRRRRGEFGAQFGGDKVVELCNHVDVLVERWPHLLHGAPETTNDLPHHRRLAHLPLDLGGASLHAWVCGTKKGMARQWGRQSEEH